MDEESHQGFVENVILLCLVEVKNCHTCLPYVIDCLT